MDSYQNFIETFQQAISTRDFAALTNNLKSGQGFLAIISLEHRESIVHTIFDKSNGLLCFLKCELERRVEERWIDNAFTEGFHFLKFFIENFYTTSCFAQYILQIKDVCESALTIKCSHYTKKAACNVFAKLIELFSDHDLRLSETVEKFIIAFPKNNKKEEIKERRLILRVYGKIVKHNGNGCLSQKRLSYIFRLLYSDASEQYKQNTNFPNDFHIYFDVFMDMLDSIEPPEELRKKLFCESYKWIKNFSQPDRQQSIVMISAIDLLSRHMNLFQDYLYLDCRYWYNVLRRLSCKTTASGACGQRALKTFYRVIGHILEIDSSEDARKLLLYFLEEFEKEFKNTGLDLTTLKLVVYGFSQMAAPCKLHRDQPYIRHMYSVIASYALPLCSSEQSNSTHIENICCYQEALSEMLCHMTDVTIENINVLVKLSIYTIKRFPDLVISNNTLAVSALIKTISKLAIINKNLLQQYLDNIIYDGIAWSCSHTLALDAELQRELNNLQQSPICYKNYLPLWTELLNVKRYLGCEQMVQHVANTLMNVCITLVGRLDIRVKRINEDIVYSDVALTQSALNQADFRVFTNLVDLYIDMIDASELSLFANTVCRFLFEIVRLSYRYPLISGFYKLVRTGMKIFVACASEEEEDTGESQWMKELLSNYLARTLDLIPTFSNELLIACLYLILDSPHAYFKDALPCTLPAFRIAFTVGLSNLELAYTALITLETWTEQERQQKRTNELLREIVAYLEPYLRSTESSVEVSQDLMVTTTRSRVKRVEVINTECMLQNFQRRVLLFLGSLDHDLLSSFVHDRASRSTGASWDHKNLVKYTLPLPDARPNIHFDRILPRIIALARESSDRRTKIAACEVLHSMVALIIGSTARHLSDPENRFTALYGILCPAMLVLGCDSDEVVRGLFQPLMLQLMHWLSSRLMLLSPLVSPVLDSLFDSLTDDSNPALREFSGTCLAEFTRWSLKQAPEVKEVQSNVHRIVQKINELALHPSIRKRVAAAVAFNHLYAILREDDDTVSIYWLEIFYCFVCSLNDECDDPSIANALAHIEKVMKFKADLLNAPGPPDRRKPHEFDGATLTHALYWLLSRCGTLDERCRAKCMELYINISQHVDSYPHKTIQIFVKTYGMDRLNDIVLRGLESGVEDISTIGHMMPLLKALDCYVWLMENQLLSIETLFPATDDAREHTIFSCIHSFTRQFQQITEDFSAEGVAINSRELEQLQTLQCKTLMTTLNFIQMLLNINVNILPKSLWDESLFALTIKCIMFPRAVGFDIRNIEMTDKLPHVLEILLNTMKSQLTYALPNIFKECLLNFGRKYIARLLYLVDIAQNNLGDSLIQHVKGLILLQRCDMLDRMILEESGFAHGEKTVKRIFKFLVNKRIGEWICRSLNARMIEYLRTLMEFQLSLFSSTIEAPNLVIPEDTRSITETLMKFISNNTLIIGTDSTQITHGEYFLNMFKDAIFGFMLTHVAAITLVFDDLSRDNPSFLLKWLEDLLLYLKQHRRELQAHVDATVDAILRHFTCLKNAVCNNDSRRERLMNIYGTVVRLSSNPVKITRDSAFPEIYQWILDQLIGNNGLEYKMQILQRFLICLTDVTTDDSGDRLELRRILLSLKSNDRELFLNLSETSVNSMKVIDCFETLLILLSTTKSIIMLECVIQFAAGTGDRLCQDEKIEEHLREYYRGTSSEHALRSLEMTYCAFMNRDIFLFETERFDVLRRFLLPTFKFCDAIAIEHFFERNICELRKFLSDLITTTDNTNVKQIIVSKIGCFQLITIMFATVDMNKIIGKNATIAINALNQIETGRELIQSLMKLAYEVRALRITESGCNELMRLLYCSAYNCELTIISLKEEERYYLVAFSNRLSWENIVDCNKRYQLGQTFKEYPKTREIAVNMRSTTFNIDEPQHRYAYVHSYDLSASTLCEDINAYDFNRSVLLPFNPHRSVSAENLGDSHGPTSIALEIDDFNEHECMPYICVLLRRIKEIFVLNNELPKWLSTFLNGLKKCPNIVLFLLRIIWNTVDVFQPYAKFMLTPIVKAVANYLEQNDLNYIITDILEILMDWHDVAVPSNEDDRTQAQILFEKLIDKVLVETFNNERRVYDYNLGLIKTMVEKWHSYLRVPNDLLNTKMTSAPKAAVYLILVLLDNGMTEEIVARDDIVDFLLKPLRDWKTSETDKTPLQCSECLGLYLKSLDNRNEVGRQIKERKVREKILTILGSMQSYQYLSKQVKCIAVLCRTYPEVAVDYIIVTFSAMAKNVERSYCLEIFTLFMSRLNASDDESAIVSKLRHMQLEKILTDRVPFCEKLALGIVGNLVTIMQPSDLLLYVNLTISYIKDITTEHRELVYDILMKTYGKYSADMTAKDDPILQSLLSISVEKLLTGLLDPSQELQDRILRFWTEETTLSTEKSKNRLLGLLSMHSMLKITTMTTSSEDDAFAPFMALLMLQLATKSMDYNKNIFDAPLHDDCTFENYKVAVSWRRRNLSCMTPMFVNSLASQMSYGTFSQINADTNLYGTLVDSYSLFSRYSSIPLRLRATQDLQFEPTLLDDETTDANFDAEFDRSITASSSRQSSQDTTMRKRPSRLLANSSDVANIIRRKQIQKNVQRAEMMKQESIRQRSSVKLYRNYRIGDFPDIEISHSNLIVPLQQLIKLDRLICKDVTVSLFCSLIEETTEREKSDDFRQTVVDSLKRILQDSSERDSSFNAVILETLLQLNVTDCDPLDIAKISKTSRLDVLGALLLERNLLPDMRDDDSPTPSKRMRGCDNDETDKWVQLASLYKSLNDVDVVLSIFRGQRFFGDDMQEAAFAEVKGDWIQARDAYTSAYERMENRSIREHCFQGLFEAVENLCDWSAINRLVKSRTSDENLDGVWKDTWKDWMIPYAFDAYVHMRAEKNWTSCGNDLPVIQSWMNDRDKLKYLKHVVGKDLMMFLLMGEEQQRQATDLLNELLDKTGEQWVSLNPLCTERGIRESLKLQAINDLNASLKVLRCANEANYLDRLDALLNFWSSKVPTVQDNLVQWNKLTAYRTFSSMLFENIFDNMEEDDDEEEKRAIIKERMRRSGFQLRLGIADAALHQKHRYIAERHLNYMNEHLQGIHYPHPKLPLELSWLEARIKCLYADIETDARTKMANYTASWKCSHLLLNESGELNANMNTAIKQHVGALASKIECSSRENAEFANALASNAAILQKIGIAESTRDLNNIREHLLQYSLNNLRACCEDAAKTAATNVGEHYCALARHCYGRLTSTDIESDELFHEFLLSTLRSMRYDYLEAAHYFPCLLRPERLRNEEMRTTFVRECAELQPWLFLRWQDLLFSHLGTPSIASAVVPIVERLAEAYPDAVAYTYHLVIERNPAILQDENIQRVRSLLRDKAEKYEQFLRAIQYVAQPELYLKYYLDEVMRDLSRGRGATAIESLLQKVYPSTRAAERNNPRPGDIYRMIARYESKIRALNPDNRDATREGIRRIMESLDESLFIRATKNRLNDYSPFLHQYMGGGIEIPGQYTGDREPILRYHARIARFEPRVAVMRSLRKPIRICMMGDNGKEYKFLVKFGEDLTIDRGLQQLYNTMNRTLSNDASCRERRLAIDTYEVIPLSKSFGLIQWIEDTKSLEDLVRFTLSKKESDRCKKIRNEYAEWIARATPSKRSQIDQYKEAASRYSWQTVTEQMERFVGETKRTALRDAFVAVSPSPECFATLRRNFVASYATMCTAHWLAGIGDRHLQNTLVRVTTGRCLGIDFGHAFGGGLRAPIPELVPFRLTPQILELLLPFTERDLLATIMTHAMRALRDDRGPILACMDIFIHKPVNRSSNINDEETTTRDDDEEVDADLTWSSKRNIEIVAKKLDGIHPSLITLEQLREAHNDKYFTRYHAIVIGNDEVKQARADIRNDCLTPAKQVDCLLDQAKDFNILGRMYVNWQPWL
ncbi:DNA-dependent protein kinase catalytic subunit-like isoform X2 [Formica exsecta]|uniref:DNA-dependent protein kinase catalytic subunit-like isoform X2 n=1 Tax=Formica exsecta TaxID=72781 RepID=UPI001142BC81|nr:DNA-dependent protein kinase catalytic subunit-like isoform X2 [Formica exsecta]